MSVLLIGARGKMGTRYRHIFDSLNITHHDLDLGFEKEDLGRLLTMNSKVVITTPTDKHFETVMTLCERKEGNKKIDLLIEKPVCKSLEMVEQLNEECQSKNITPYVVNQYNHYNKSLLFSHSSGPSFYDYYNTGSDGLKWDCFQIIALAKDRPELFNKSPVWTCQINGYPLEFGEMDWAYYRMMASFNGQKQGLWGPKEMIRATKKVLEYE